LICLMAVGIILGNLAFVVTMALPLLLIVAIGLVGPRGADALAARRPLDRCGRLEANRILWGRGSAQRGHGGRGHDCRSNQASRGLARQPKPVDVRGLSIARDSQNTGAIRQDEDTLTTTRLHTDRCEAANPRLRPPDLCLIVIPPPQDDLHPCRLPS
jgi:hypothetical protein